MTSATLNSFEVSEWTFRPRGSLPVKLIIIYRLPYSRAHPVSIGTFFTELTGYLESVILCQLSILITGDFNIHVDGSSNINVLRFHDLLESFGLEQHVRGPTYTHGHTLDLIIITRTGDHILKESPKADFCISDHMSVICCLSLLKSPLIKTLYRKLGNVNIPALKVDLRLSSNISQTHSNINKLAESFNITLSSLLEVYAQLIKNITTRPRVLWFSDEIKAIKRRRKRAEKLWRKTKKESDLRIKLIT